MKDKKKTYKKYHRHFETHIKSTVIVIVRRVDKSAYSVQL